MRYGGRVEWNRDRTGWRPIPGVVHQLIRPVRKNARACRSDATSLVAGVEPTRRTTMRFMMLMYPGPYPTGAVPDAKSVEAMMKYNEQLAKAGVLLALDGLQSQDGGARIRF